MRIRRKTWTPKPVPPVVPVLTPRQLDVLKAWWAGEKTAETADRMGVKVDTVQFYRDQARLRLNGAKDLQTAVRRALKHKLITSKVGG